MKKILLRTRIVLTNVSRLIMSFLFINLNFSLANKMKIASSLHAKKTATNVPTVIFLLMYKSLAATLIPH